MIADIMTKLVNYSKISSSNLDYINRIRAPVTSRRVVWYENVYKYWL